MHPNESAHHLALLSLLIAAAGLSVILQKWGKHHGRSLSSHSGRQPSSYWLFAGSLIVSGALFTLFAFDWFTPTFNLGSWFGAIVVIAVICELVAALVPDNGGWHSVLHGIGAWTMAVFMLFIVVALLFIPHISVIAKFVVSLLLSYLVLDWFLFLFVKWSRQRFLIFQSTYILCFYLAILAVTYIR